MIIEIDDDLSGDERRRLITIKQTEYAIELKGSKRAASRFLGISERALRNWCNKYPELSKYKAKEVEWLTKKSLEQQMQYKDMMRRYPNRRYSSEKNNKCNSNSGSIHNIDIN